MILLGASLSLMLLPVKSNALEPFTAVVGALSILSSVKTLSNGSEELHSNDSIEENYSNNPIELGITQVLFSENLAENKMRVKEIRRNFKWGGYYEEGDCVNSHDKKIDKQITVCYIEGKWKVIDD